MESSHLSRVLTTTLVVLGAFVAGSATTAAIVGTNGQADLAEVIAATTWTPQPTAMPTLSVTSNPDLLPAETYKIISTGMKGIAVGVFTVQAKSADAVIEAIGPLEMTVDGTYPSVISLYDGSTLVASKKFASSSGVVDITLTGLNVSLPKDSIKTFTFKVDMPAGTKAGTKLAPQNVYIKYRSGLKEAEFSKVPFNVQSFGTASSTQSQKLNPVEVISTSAAFGDTAKFGNKFAFDGNPKTFFASWSTSTTPGTYIGAQFSGYPVLTAIKFYPRIGYESRMAGGLIQGSNDASFNKNVATFYEFGTSTPTKNQYTTVKVSNTKGYKFYRYFNPKDSDVAEIEFQGIPAN